LRRRIKEEIEEEGEERKRGKCLKAFIFDFLLLNFDLYGGL
jgi:hypothetical protein